MTGGPKAGSEISGGDCSAPKYLFPLPSIIPINLDGCTLTGCLVLNKSLSSSARIPITSNTRPEHTASCFANPCTSFFLYAFKHDRTPSFSRGRHNLPFRLTSPYIISLRLSTPQLRLHGHCFSLAPSARAVQTTSRPQHDLAASAPTAAI